MSAKPASPSQKLRDLASRPSLVRASELGAWGIHGDHIRRLCAKGELERVRFGLYRIPDVELTAQHGLVRATMAVPKGVICLVSALQFHGIGKRSSDEVWIALNGRAALPWGLTSEMRVVRLSGPAWEFGVEKHVIEGVQVQVFSLAKTIADCFKFRSKIGANVAIAALRDVLRDRRCSVEELREYSDICRVAWVMRPYIETILSLE